MNPRVAAVAAVLALVLAAQPVHGAWPIPLADSRNTGADPDAYTVPRHVIWQVDDTGFLDAGPVVAGGLVVVGSRDGHIYAYNASDGERQWAFDMEQAVVASPVIGLGRVFAANEKGDLVALDLQTGGVLARTKLGPSQGAITLHEGKLFVGNEEGKVTALTATLDKLWVFDVAKVREEFTLGNATTATRCTGGPHPARPVRTAPAVYGDHVYFAGMNHYIYAVDEGGNPDQTTDLLWSARADDIVLASPVVGHAEGRLFVASYDETVRSLALAPPLEASNPCIGLRLDPHWTRQVPGPVGNSKIHGSPALADGRLFVGANNGKVFGIDTADGQIAWTFDTGGPVLAAPVWAQDLVIVGSEDGSLYWLSAEDGKLVHRQPMGAAIKASVAPDGRDTYVALATGGLVRLSADPLPPPDLQVKAVVGDEAGVRATIVNGGAGPSKATDVLLQLDGVDIGTVAIGVLRAGEEVEVDVAHVLEPGLHTVTAHIDPEAAHPDTLRDNNLLDGAAFIPDPLPPEDLEEPVVNATGNATGGLFGLPWITVGAAGAGILAVGTGVAMLILRRRKAGSEEEEDEEDDEG